MPIRLQTGTVKRADQLQKRNIGGCDVIQIQLELMASALEIPQGFETGLCVLDGDIAMDPQSDMIGRFYDFKWIHCVTSLK
jgi:hypothetical protein